MAGNAVRITTGPIQKMALSLGRLVTSIIIACGGKGGRSQSAQRINSPSDCTLLRGRGGGGTKCVVSLFVTVCVHDTNSEPGCPVVVICLLGSFRI